MALTYLAVAIALFASSFAYTPKELAKRAKKLKADDKKLARGYLSLALHLDPFLIEDPQLSWLSKALKGEPLEYWHGNAFVGHDKTMVESLLGQPDLYAGAGSPGLALLSWRNLDLTGLSCCGIDNLAVFFSQNKKHPYVAPFVDLVPGYGKTLKLENVKMYESFRDWWISTGRRPMPDPKVIRKSDGGFEYSPLRVVYKSSRIPEGWNELIQAVLLQQYGKREEAAAAAREALLINPELQASVSDLLSGLVVPPPLASLPLMEQKYIICYNPHVGLGNIAVVITSAKLLAKITGRKFILSWNANAAVRHGFRLLDSPNVGLLENSVGELGVAPQDVRELYFFHMMHSPDLGSILELMGCSDLTATLAPHRVVSVSSNLFFGPLLTTNPTTPDGFNSEFPDMLRDTLVPSDDVIQRAVTYLRGVQWGKKRPVVAIHVRAREEGEDNDDWPTAAAPAGKMLQHLRRCVLGAIQRELPREKGWFGKAYDPEWDLFVASTTVKSRKAVASALNGAAGLQNILELPDVLLGKRTSKQGSVDAMTEALLLSRADIFVRLVVGTSGFSTFAYLSNALSHQNHWVPSDMPELIRSGFAPNYLVTDKCSEASCYQAPARVRMADIAWHGEKFTKRSCGNVLDKVRLSGTEALGCRGLTPIEALPKKTEL